MSEDELVLESIGSWSSELLKQQLRSGKISRNVDPAEVAAAAAESVVRIIYIQEKTLCLMRVGCLILQVEHVLKFPFHSNLDRMEHKWHMEHFKKQQGFQMFKSAYR